jgi:LuxR family maltose regulon positive regulatory protein
VLDDYHVIDTSEVREGMVFLLDHLPWQLHLVIAGRVDPALPLRGCGRAGAHRDAGGRAAVHSRRGRDVSERNDGAGTAPDMAALVGRTEGWIAALQLAALFQGETTRRVHHCFAGDDRYIVDYLVSDVECRPRAA